MATPCNYFFDDVVYKINKKGFVDVGTVIENDDGLSSDEDSEDSEYGRERMKKAYIRVAWHRIKPQHLLSEQEVKLCDRSLMPGDVVQKIVKGKETQLGYCRYTTVQGDVQVIGTDHVIVGVSSKDLPSVDEFGAGRLVFKDHWLGTVRAMKIELTLQCNDGSRCLMLNVDAIDVLGSGESVCNRCRDCFYVGQQLSIPTRCFQKAKWLNLTQSLGDTISCPDHRIRVTVEDVKIVSLNIAWDCLSHLKTPSIDPPSSDITNDDIKTVKGLNFFGSCTLQIGDRNYFVIKDSCKVLSLSEWKNCMLRRWHADQQNYIDIETLTGNSPEINCNDEREPVPVLENKDSSRCDDIMEEESEISLDTSLDNGCFVRCLDKNTKNQTEDIKCTCDQTKLKNLNMCPVMKESVPLKAGKKYATETLVTETKALVVWQDGTIEHDVLSTSLYPVYHVDDQEFFPGDFVAFIKESCSCEYGVVQQVNHSGRTALVTWWKTNQSGTNFHHEIISEQEVSVYDIKEHPDFGFRAGTCVILVVNSENSSQSFTAGQVVDTHTNGKVEVYWVNGETSMVYPQELYRLGKEYFKDPSSDDGDDWSYKSEEIELSDSDSWETESETHSLGPEKESVAEIGVASTDCEEVDLNAVDMFSDAQKKLVLVIIDRLLDRLSKTEAELKKPPMIYNFLESLRIIYKCCKLLDRAFGSTYFSEEHLQSLLNSQPHSNRHMTEQLIQFLTTDVGSTETGNSQEGVSVKNALLESSIDIEGVTESPTDQVPAAFTNCVVESHKLSLAPASLNKLPLAPASLNKLSLAPVIDGVSESPTDQVPVASTNCVAESHKLSLAPASLTPNLQFFAILKLQLINCKLRLGLQGGETSAILPEEKDPNQNKPSELNQKQTNSKEGDSELLSDDQGEMPGWVTAEQGVFSMLNSVTDTHKYKLSTFQPADPSAFFRRVTKEIYLLRSSLPKGIIVKGFEDRIDLYSVLIEGPRGTPYEDCLFVFDLKLPKEYPARPPHCHYICYCSGRLNPNLYEEGRVCVSLLGTFAGKGIELWNPQTSNLLQVIVSIQGLILVSEPYYNEAGYERQKGTELGMERSRIYNEMVLLKLIQSMSKMLVSPPEIFQEEIMKHFKTHSSKLIQRLERWLEISESHKTDHLMQPNTANDTHSQKNADREDIPLPEFPLIPASKGFCLTMRKSLADFQSILAHLL